MRSLRILLLTLVTVLAFANASARTVAWAISPTYDQISRFSSDLFLVQKNAKWGMVKPGNIEVLPAVYDFITPMVNGYSLAGSKEGNYTVLEAIIADDGEIVKPDAKYYLTVDKEGNVTDCFSEGKLRVVNKNGKYGFINQAGNNVVRCQFDFARPFRNGLAPVRQRNLYRYIGENFDRSNGRDMLIVDFHLNDLTQASCFSNGRAVVAYNKDFALIDKNGKPQKIKEADFNRLFKEFNNVVTSSAAAIEEQPILSVYSQDGLVGLKAGSDVVARPQFDSVLSQFGDGYVITAKSGRQGVLAVADGSYSLNLNAASGGGTQLDVDRRGNIGKVMLDMSAPADARDLKLMVDCGDGTLHDYTSHLSGSNNRLTASISPCVNSDADDCRMRAVLENDGITVAETQRDFTLSHPVILRVSAPQAVSRNADKNDNVTIYAVISNDSNRAVTVTATLDAKGRVTQSLTIKPHDKARISKTIKVTQRQSVNASVSLSTGEHASSQLYLGSFFEPII